MLSHNSYFDGRVQSVGFERNGRRLSAGVIDSGEFHFGTEAAERMTVTSGELAVRVDGTSDWKAYPTGTCFEIAANSGFDVKAEAPAAYVCEYL